MNRLYYGDCMTIMQEFRSASVDLIYLDPPFNSNRQYNSIYRDETGRPLPDQIEAFWDMWELDGERENAIRTMPILMREKGIDDATVEFWRLWMRALRDTNPRLLAYLSYMTQRLLMMPALLKPTGSLYFHCDPTVSHYIKPLLDAMFGHENFVSEIVWKRTSAHSSARRFGPVHDTLLLYSKGARWTWNQLHEPYSAEHLKRFRRKDPDGRAWTDADLTGAGVVRDGETGQPWRGIDVSEQGRHWSKTRAEMDRLDAEGRIHWPQNDDGMPRLKRYLDELKGRRLQSVWTDIPPINSQAKERMGFATQKPLALMERIIKTSSNPGDVILDPFCGCATTLEAAHKLDRQWIGIDIAIHAIKRVARIRLQDKLGLVQGQHFSIEGVPRNVEGAHDLWKRDKYHFQKWAIEQVDGFVTAKRSADGGIDGRIYFALPNELDLRSMVLEVKGGTNVSIQDLRALRGVLEADPALMAGLIVLHPLSATKARNFRTFMQKAGSVEVLGVDYPKMQMLTVEQIFEGARFETPSKAVGLHQPQPRMPGLPE